jgi:hypothetical protein
LASLYSFIPSGHLSAVKPSSSHDCSQHWLSEHVSTSRHTFVAPAKMSPSAHPAAVNPDEAHVGMQHSTSSQVEHSSADFDPPLSANKALHWLDPPMLSSPAAFRHPDA